MNRNCRYNLDASIDDPWYCTVGSDSSYRKSTGPVDLRLGLLLSSGFIEVPLHRFPSCGTILRQPPFPLPIDTLYLPLYQGT